MMLETGNNLPLYSYYRVAFTRSGVNGIWRRRARVAGSEDEI